MTGYYLLQNTHIDSVVQWPRGYGTSSGLQLWEPELPAAGEVPRWEASSVCCRNLPPTDSMEQDNIGHGARQKDNTGHGARQQDNTAWSKITHSMEQDNKTTQGMEQDNKTTQGME